MWVRVGGAGIGPTDHGRAATRIAGGAAGILAKSIFGIGKSSAQSTALASSL
jgi:hypothetical protein